MNPCNFPESNTDYGPPKDLEESQCGSLPAYIGQVVGGSCDGCYVSVVQWELTDAEIEIVKSQKKIFLSVMGRLPPHWMGLNFHDATHPA